MGPSRIIIHAHLVISSLEFSGLRGLALVVQTPVTTLGCGVQNLAIDPVANPGGGEKTRLHCQLMELL